MFCCATDSVLQCTGLTSLDSHDFPTLDSVRTLRIEGNSKLENIGALCLCVTVAEVAFRMSLLLLLLLLSTDAFHTLLQVENANEVSIQANKNLQFVNLFAFRPACFLLILLTVLCSGNGIN